MRSLSTILRREFKNLFLTADYLGWALLDPSKFRKIDKKNIKKAVVIHLGCFGEILVATSLVKCLSGGIGNKVDFMVKSNQAQLLKNNKHISKILVYKNSVSENIKLLKAGNYDLAVILYPGTTKMAYLCLKAGIKYRVGCYNGVKSGPAFLFTRRVFPVRNINAIQKNLEMIEQIGFKEKNPKFEYSISKEEKNWTDTFLKKRKIKNYVVVHVGFSGFNPKTNNYPSKLWPPERYAEVIDYLIENYGMKVFLTGGKDEKELSESVMAQVKNKKNVIIANDLLGIRELSSLISRARLFFCAPTGISYIGFALNVPTITFLGTGDVEEWADERGQFLNKNCKILFHKDVCTGCSQSYCRKKIPECIVSITAKEAISEIEKFMKK